MSPARLRGGCVAAALLLLTAGLHNAAQAQAQVQAPAPSAAPEAPAEVHAALKTPMLQGQGGLRFLGLRVYEARLWVPAGQLLGAGGDSSAQPLALEIRYQRALQGAQIAARSLQEMRRQGALDDSTALRWQQALQALLPDVRDGTRITGVHLPGVGAQFHVDGRLRGSVDEPEFARRFFGIWLSPASSDPKLRAALLGPAGAAPS